MNVIQCKMARAALGWSLDDLAAASEVGRRTIARFESGDSVQAAGVEKMRATFVAQGIEFINGGKRAGATYLRKD